MIAGLLLFAAVGPPAPAADRHQTIAIRWDAGTKACVPTVRGVDTGDVGSEAGREALVVSLPDKGAELQVTGSGGVPYACVSGMIDALKRGGYYGRIALTTGPRPDRAMR